MTAKETISVLYYPKGSAAPIEVTYGCLYLPRKGETVFLCSDLFGTDVPGCSGGVECSIERVFHLCKKRGGARVVVIAREKAILIGKTDLENITNSLGKN